MFVSLAYRTQLRFFIFFLYVAYVLTNYGIVVTAACRLQLRYTRRSAIKTRQFAVSRDD